MYTGLILAAKSPRDIMFLLLCSGGPASEQSGTIWQRVFGVGAGDSRRVLWCRHEMAASLQLLQGSVDWVAPSRPPSYPLLITHIHPHARHGAGWQI